MSGDTLVSGDTYRQVIRDMVSYKQVIGDVGVI